MISPQNNQSFMNTFNKCDNNMDGAKRYSIANKSR